MRIVFIKNNAASGTFRVSLRLIKVTFRAIHYLKQDSRVLPINRDSLTRKGFKGSSEKNIGY